MVAAARPVRGALQISGWVINVILEARIAGVASSLGTRLANFCLSGFSGNWLENLEYPLASHGP
jgi:hypothetical protein